MTIVSCLASSYLWIKKYSNNIFVITFLLLGFLIPPFVHSATWSQILVNFFGFSYRSISTLKVAGWVQFSCYSSLGTGIMLLALSKINKKEIVAAKIYREDKYIFSKIIIPSIKPVIIIIFGIVFILSFSDYTVPSLFAQSVYSQEIMGEFNSSYDQTRALFLAIPLLVVQISVFVIILIQLKQDLYQKSESYDYDFKIKLPKIYDALLFISLLMVLSSIILPIGILILSKDTISSLPGALEAADKELLSSLKINLLAALGIMIFILPLSLSVLATKNSKTFLILFVLPLILPSSLIGISLINAFFRVLPKSLYNSSLMPIIAVWQKSLPFVLPS
ncbi:MAG: ABC transporter permease subunit [Clostridia bacterium]